MGKCWNRLRHQPSYKLHVWLHIRFYDGLSPKKMAHFVPCHLEITAEDSADLFIGNCYELNGVPKVIISDRDPKFV